MKTATSSCRRRPSWGAWAVAAAAGLGAAGAASAQPMLLSAGGSITHTGNIAAVPTDFRVVSIPTLPTFSSSLFQYLPSTSLTAVSGASSGGRAGMGVLTGPTFAGVGFASGTNVTQRGNTNPSAVTASRMFLPFSARWRMGPSGFGPGLQAGATFGLVGSVPSASSAFVEVTVSATFRYFRFLGITPDGPAFDPPVVMRGSIVNPLFFRATPGLFNANVSDVVPATPGFAAPNDEIEIVGSLSIRVHNAPDAGVQLAASALTPVVGLVINDGTPITVPATPPEIEVFVEFDPCDPDAIAPIVRAFVPFPPPPGQPLMPPLSVETTVNSVFGSPIPLLDDGIAPDQFAGDGFYSAFFLPPGGSATSCPGAVVVYDAQGAMRARVVDLCALVGACCLADINSDDTLNDDDLGEFITAYFEMFPGPSRYADGPCPGADAPFDVFGYAADINDDCSLNDDDLGLFITLFFQGC